jgi:hypothetical protein
LSTAISLKRRQADQINFKCPNEGKWPNEDDCGRYFTCNSESDANPTAGWCGPGMSFDVENQRCEMALAINCKDGEREGWEPPENCKQKRSHF